MCKDNKRYNAAQNSIQSLFYIIFHEGIMPNSYQLFLFSYYTILFSAIWMCITGK